MNQYQEEIIQKIHEKYKKVNTDNFPYKRLLFLYEEKQYDMIFDILKCMYCQPVSIAVIFYLTIEPRTIEELTEIIPMPIRNISYGVHLFRKKYNLKKKYYLTE